MLPLVDAARDLTGDSAWAFLDRNAYGLVAAGTSFLAIGLFWMGHHRLFARVTGYTSWLLRANLLWLAGIAFMPLATELDVGASRNDGGSVVYLGTIGFTLAAARIEAIVIARSGLLPDAAAPSTRALLAPWVPIGILVLATIAVAVLPAIGLYALLPLLLTRPLERLIRGAPRRRAT